MDNELLIGDKVYKIYFLVDEFLLELVDVFWFVILYSVLDYYVILNKLNKFCINNYLGLKLSEDGSLMFYIVLEKLVDVDLGNWLLSKVGKEFLLNFWLYVLKKEVLEGKVFLLLLEVIK